MKNKDETEEILQVKLFENAMKDRKIKDEFLAALSVPLPSDEDEDEEE